MTWFVGRGDRVPGSVFRGGASCRRIGVSRPWARVLPRPRPADITTRPRRTAPPEITSLLNPAAAFRPRLGCRARSLSTSRPTCDGGAWRPEALGQPRSASASRGRAHGGAQCTHDGLRGEPGRNLRVGRGSGPKGRRPPGHVSLLLAAAKRSRKLAGPFRRRLAPWREALSLLRGRPPAADPSWANPASGATLPLHSLPSRHGVRGPELNAARKAGRGQGRTPALLPSGSEAFSSPATKRPAFRTKETSRCLRSRPGTLAWKSRSASASLHAQGQPCSAPRYETNPVRVAPRTLRAARGCVTAASFTPA